MIVETARGRVSLERVGRGPDLLLLHSLLSDRHVFARIEPHLSASWRLNEVDLPGFGASTRVEPSIDAYADLMGALLDAGDYDPDTTVLLGNGLGAFVALGTAVRHGSRFDRLVLVGCGGAFSESGREAFPAMIDAVREGGMESVLDTAVRRIYTGDYIAGHPAEAEERRAVLRRTSPEAFIDACRALYEVDYRKRLVEVANPTLVVVGEDDGATPPALARELRNGIPGAALHELPGVAHAPQLQDPDGFMKVVGPFLLG